MHRRQQIQFLLWNGSLCGIRNSGNRVQYPVIEAFKYERWDALIRLLEKAREQIGAKNCPSLAREEFVMNDLVQGRQHFSSWIVSCQAWLSTNSFCIRPTAAATTAAIVETVLPTTILPRTRIVPFSTARPTLTTFAEYAWITKSWTLCSVTCGTGYQKRRVRCVENATRTIKQDSLCDAESVPVSFKQCSLPPCPSASGKSWFIILTQVS